MIISESKNSCVFVLLHRFSQFLMVLLVARAPDCKLRFPEDLNFGTALTVICDFLQTPLCPPDDLSGG